MILGVSIFLLMASCRSEGELYHEPYDVCVYGGTSSGVVAAYSASLMGKKVLLIEPGRHLGGLSSGGLGQTDIGNKHAVTGISRDFYRRLGKVYGKLEAWKFEPHEAEKVFNDMVREGNFEVLMDHRLLTADMKKNHIRSIMLEQSSDPDQLPRKVIRADYFIDCSYEGDLMAEAGVSYTVGREDNSLYGENYNGVQLLDKHQFPDGIDPYVFPGDPSNGLLPGINPEPLEPRGTGDKKVQAYNYRLCLTRDTGNRVPLTKPEGYDPMQYELLRRVILHRDSIETWKHTLHEYLIISRMPKGKTDINNKGPVSTDYIGQNWAYPEADYATREKIAKAHEQYIRGLLYFLSHHPDVPDTLRNQMLSWGWAKDEFTDNGNFPHQMYVREARRMIGEYVMTEHNCLGDSTVDDGIGLAAYTMDSHNCQRVVVKGRVRNEGDVQVGGFPPYEISYRSLTPKREECNNLLVPVCLSASHIAFGSIRMEPVFMVLGQVAGMAVAQADESEAAVQDIGLERLRTRLKNDPLLDGTPPDVVVDNLDEDRVRVTGKWETAEKWMGQYRRNYLVNTNKTGEHNCSFIFSVPKSGTYGVYLYVPLHPAGEKQEAWKWSAEAPVLLKHALGSSRIRIDMDADTKNWVPVGSFEFNVEGKYTLTLNAAQTEDPVAADALLLVPEKIQE